MKQEDPIVRSESPAFRRGEEVNAPIVALDTETDGVHPGRNVWEVAMIRRDDDGQRECTFFVDIDLETADPFGLRVGGFYDRHPLGRWLSNVNDNRAGRPDADKDATRSYLPGRDAAGEVAQWTHGAHIVGAVPNFDTETLAPLLRWHGLTPAWHYHLIDVEALAVGFLAGRGAPVSPPWRSDELTEKLGLDPVPESERHTALGDARWAMRIYDAVMAAS